MESLKAEGVSNPEERNTPPPPPPPEMLREDLPATGDLSAKDFDCPSFKASSDGLMGYHVVLAKAKLVVPTSIQFSNP